MTKFATSSQDSFPLTTDCDQVIADLKVSSADRILIYLAISVMKLGGHRYGAFLEAANTAAKLAIYSSYLEQSKNVRKTSFLHHVEPKRVRAIIKEVEGLIAEGRSLTTLSDQEPYYLIGLPYLWQEKYPWEPGLSRLNGHHLTAKEHEELHAQFSDNLPDARFLDLFEFLDLIKLLHTKSQAEYPLNRQMPLSEALTEHIKFRLLHSGTVTQVDIPFLSIPIFALTRTHYAPKGERERVFTMMKDLARFSKLMQGWVIERPDVIRGLEVFDVPLDKREEALEELDTLLKEWADKYHQDGGHPMILQMAAGTREPGEA
ncbi:heterocyst differentiation control protein [Oscillatoria sp. CS-180]|uniref:heterocyst differentiation control protein n=1 Tax=Oscillatoria sp. CS-180 TaxID=3021720 RepID=UPI00232F085A|nr:heterocyst differentiation control protein [Oscillatoria sp. CS-180]MDB9525049.1 heterocyst differentiation control protein [Oscillatoria sp. CS-180]